MLPLLAVVAVDVAELVLLDCADGTVRTLAALEFAAAAIAGAAIISALIEMLDTRHFAMAMEPTPVISRNLPD